MPNNHHKLGYGVSLFLGAIGYTSIFLVHSQMMLIVSFILIGISWAGIDVYKRQLLNNLA